MLVTTGPGELGVALRVEVEGDLGTAYPSGDGGLHIMSDDGTLRTYDSVGRVTSTLATGYEGLYASTSDDSVGGTGRLVFGGRSDVIVVDPATGEILEVADVGEVTSVGFARGGELLVIAATDGSVQLWDVERSELLGVLWDGSGSRHQNPPWSDETSNTVWVASSGQLLQLSVDPERWVERACEIVGREFTQDEWDRFVPGGGEAQSACAG